MGEEDDGRLVCATYTHARRHPMVLGKIGDWTPPFQVTLAQVGVILASLLVLHLTWDIWAGRLPFVLVVAVLVGVPGVLAAAARKARVEGRSLLRAGLGWIAYAAVAGRHQVSGRAYRDRVVTLDDGWVYVTAAREGDR